MSFSLTRNLTALYLIKVAKWMNLVMPLIRDHELITFDSESTKTFS